MPGLSLWHGRYRWKLFTLYRGKQPDVPVRATRCEDCEFGYSTDGKHRKWCSPGYKPNPTRTACAGCVEGWFSSDVQNSTHVGIRCRRCEPAVSQMPAYLPADVTNVMTRNTAQDMAAFVVPVEMAKSQTLRKRCTPCPPGHAGSRKCNAPGTTPDVLQIECVLCPPRTIGRNGTCSECPDGKEPDVLRISCQSCSLMLASWVRAATAQLVPKPITIEHNVYVDNNQVSTDGVFCALCSRGCVRVQTTSLPRMWPWQVQD